MSLVPAELDRPRVTVKLLGKFYPVVKTLHCYLQDLVDLGSTERSYAPGPADTPAYFHLLNQCLVGDSNADGALKRVGFAPPMSTMRETVEFTVKKILSSNSGRDNVLSQGYSFNKHAEGLYNRQVNTNVIALCSDEWETLHSRIGTDAMVHLLANSSFFFALPNDCFCQLSGTPIAYIHLDDPHLYNGESTSTSRVPKRKLLGLSEGPRKRMKLDNGNSAARGAPDVKLHRPSPSQVLLARSKLFYARPSIHSHRNARELIAGLPSKRLRANNAILRKAHALIDVLNRLNGPKSNRITDSVGPVKLMEQARHLSKYVFPRQYGLANVFRFELPRREGFRLPDFGDREDEIRVSMDGFKKLLSMPVTYFQRLGQFKTPKRLKDAVPMLEKILWRHGKCSYSRLRDLTCPTKTGQLRKSDLDSSELISEHPSSNPRTQPPPIDHSLDSEGNSIQPNGLTQAAFHAKNKPRFVEYSCSYNEVYRYVILVSKAVIPKTFWGTEENFKHLCRHVKRFIACRRYESLSLHGIVQGFSTSACDWLMPPGSGTQQKRVPVTDALKRRQLLEDFLFWYFDSFLLPLLRTTFYVTESSALRNQILYFRHDDWEFLCAPLIDHLAGGTFQKIPVDEAKQMLRQRKLGFSFIRLLPKETGVRPIANLKRKGSAQDGRSINQILHAAFKILSYERDHRPHLVGASVFNVDHVYVRLKTFKQGLLQGNAGRLPKLYFVKVDVQACFDTIPQRKLLEILRNILSEDKYLIHRYAKVAPEVGNVKRTYMQTAVPGSEYPHFLQTAAKLASVLHNTIFVDQVRYSQTQRQEILHLLEEHIEENMVKIGSDYYRQTVGIPQGSILSTLLCCFFYGDLEGKVHAFSQDERSTLLRQTDDYLFITADFGKARRFLDVMNRGDSPQSLVLSIVKRNEGHAEYGCFISQDKTLTNFDYDGHLNSIPLAKGFPWCGYVMDTRDLSVSVEYSRYHDSDLKGTLTVTRGRRPGTAFKHKMLLLAKARTHVIFNDSTLNSQTAVLTNIYQNFLLCALKMNSYLSEWGIDVRRHTPFIWTTIQQMVFYSWAATRNKSTTQFAAAHGARCVTQKAAATWLGMHAFHTVLMRKPTNYEPLLKLIHAQLHRPPYTRYSRRFRSITQQALMDLAPIYARL
ncbi:unnamed protein product [Mycena citricolor]|uniref:Telomerase reverse transcriptase n=1 Tax=Mycena citricolor TaxID=2018698 RepID=A0AAD2H6S9_9AGAR|nr:unnamed protein product [Mycena citricolor]CAK5269313.1 unnamed protein product [Mycena citricolor]